VQASTRKSKNLHNLALHYEDPWWSKGTRILTTPLERNKWSASRAPHLLRPPIFGQRFLDAYYIAGWVGLTTRLGTPDCCCQSSMVRSQSHSNDKNWYCRAASDNQMGNLLADHSKIVCTNASMASVAPPETSHILCRCCDPCSRELFMWTLSAITFVLLASTRVGRPEPSVLSFSLNVTSSWR
jgi:hypothetical protein